MDRPTRLVLMDSLRDAQRLDDHLELVCNLAALQHAVAVAEGLDWSAIPPMQSGMSTVAIDQAIALLHQRLANATPPAVPNDGDPHALGDDREG